MIIRSYAGIPTTFVPDVGEVVMAAMSATHTYYRAAVLNVSRRKAGYVLVRVQWLDGPKVGELGYIRYRPGTGSLIRQISRERAAEPDPEAEAD